MNNLQRLINLIAIIGVLYCLLQLNQKVNQKDERVMRINKITRLILSGEQLSPDEMQMVSEMAKIQMAAESQNTPLCLIKAYSVIHAEVQAKGLFNLFQNSQQEYDNVNSCLNYYSILLYRALSLQKSVRQKVLSMVEQLQKKQIERKYPSKSNQNICVFFSTLNNQKLIQDQIAAFNSQTYSKYKVEINDRGSTDNTHIIVSYKINEISDEKDAKIVLRTNKNEGIFTGLKRFINECQSDSIILVIAQNDTIIGSNVFDAVNRVFTTEQLDMGVFNGLQTTHLNLQFAKQKELMTAKAPVLAFRNTVFQGYQKLLKFESETALQPFWRTWLTNHMLFLRDNNKLKLKIVNQALVYHQSPKNHTQIPQLQATSARYNVQS